MPEEPRAAPSAGTVSGRRSAGGEAGGLLDAAGGVDDGVAVAGAGLAGRALDRARDADRGDRRRRRRRARRRSPTPPRPPAPPRSRPIGAASAPIRRRRAPTGWRRPSRRRGAATPPSARSCAARGATRARRRRPADRPRARRAAPIRRSRRAARASAGSAASASGIASAAARPSATSRTPRANRPSSSRRTSPWTSSATASRWAVARENPVASTSSPSDRGACLDGRRGSTTPCRGRRPRLHSIPSGKISVLNSETQARPTRADDSR